MPSPTEPAASPIWKREFRIDVRPLVRWIAENPEAAIVGIGMALQVITYLWNRPMWLDESSLRGNVVGVAVLDFSGPLWQDQLAPLGFLVVERALAAINSRNYVLRAPSLAAGLVSLVLFRHLSARVLPRRSALVALALFASWDDLIYYASEFKPYSIDLAIGLAVTLLAVDAVGRTPSRRDVARMAVLLAAAPWFSFGSAFLIAGCGLVLLVDALIDGRLRAATLWLTMGLGWLAMFFAAYRASCALLDPATTMYHFWYFAFLPLGFPSTVEGLSRTADLLLEVFVNPMNLLAPGGSRLGVVLPLILLIAGGLSLARRSPRSFLLLAVPVAMAMAASVARYYPFHGRLLLELVPAPFLLIAEGTESVARRFPGRGGLAFRMLLIGLLAYPCWDACYHTTGWRDREFNIHGDLHRNVFIDRPEKAKGMGRASR